MLTTPPPHTSINTVISYLLNVLMLIMISLAFNQTGVVRGVFKTDREGANNDECEGEAEKIKGGEDEGRGWVISELRTGD